MPNQQGDQGRASDLRQSGLQGRLAREELKVREPGLKGRHHGHKKGPGKQRER